MSKRYIIHLINEKAFAFTLTDTEFLNLKYWLEGIKGTNVYELNYCVNEAEKTYKKYFFVRSSIIYVSEY